MSARDRTQGRSRAAAAESAPALSPEEWAERFAQRDSLMVVGSDDRSVALIRSGPGGDAETVRVEPAQKAAVAALALAGEPFGFAWRDYDDEIAIATLLDAYAAGIPLARLPEPFHDALDGALRRRPSLARRLAALLPPRPAGEPAAELPPLAATPFDEETSQDAPPATAGNSLEELYRAIFEQARAAVDLDTFFIAFYDVASDTASVVYFAAAGREIAMRVAYRGSESAAVRERRAVLLTAADPALAILSLAAGEGGAGHGICAPVFSDDTLAALIGAQRAAPEPYTARDLDLFAAVAGLAGVALSSTARVRDAERRRVSMELLQQVASSLGATLELPAIIDRAASAARRLMEAESAAILLFDPASIGAPPAGPDADVPPANGATAPANGGAAPTNGATASAAHGLEVVSTSGTSVFHIGEVVEIGRALEHVLFEERSGFIEADAAAAERLPPAVCERLADSSLVAAPLAGPEGPLGLVVACRSRPLAFVDDDRALLERLALHVANAIENARLLEQIRRLSLTDPLTGLPNRRQMELVLQREFAAARRGRNLAVLLFDLDRFKHYNDTRGHQAGDRLLQAFGELLAGETRAFDLAARYGGDEFLAILSDADAQGAEAHAARVREAVAHHPLLKEIGVTAGIALFEPGMTSADDLVLAADEELYRRKGERTGRRVRGH